MLNLLQIKQVMHLKETHMANANHVEGEYNTAFLEKGWTLQ